MAIAETENAAAVDAMGIESRPGKPPPSSFKSPFLNRYVIGSAVLASLNSVLLGYDIGVMSGAVLFIKEELKITTREVEILVGSLNVCSLIGSLASGKTSDWIGRRYTVVLSALLFLVGALLMGFAPSYTFLMAGRVIAGIGVGYSLMIAPVYTAELSPAATRGFFTSFPEIFITIGILLGYISNYLFTGLPERINWRVMLGISAFPAVAISVGIIVMPESPRWLVMKGRTEEAKRVLLKTSSGEAEAEQRLAEIEAAAAEDANRQAKGVWKELLLRPSPALRRMLITAVAMNFFMQASGNDAVIYYSPEVFKAAGIHRKKDLMSISMIMGASKTFFVLVSACFLDRFGRRPLLLTGSVGLTISLTGLGVGFRYLQASVQKPRWVVALCVLAVCGDVSFFSIGLGPITWVYSSEIFPTRFRAQATGIAVSINRVVSGVVSMTFLSISKAITFSNLLFIFAGISAAGGFFFFFFVPETKGKKLEEMESLFDKRKRRGGNGGNN